MDNVDLFVDRLIKRLKNTVDNIVLEIFCKEYGEYVKRNRAPKSYEGVKIVCDKLLSYFSPLRKIETIKLKDVEQFLDWVKKSAPKGVYNYHRTLRAMFNKGIEWNYLSVNVFNKVKLPKRQAEKPTSVTELLLRKITEQIKVEVVRDVIITGFYTGLRLGELASLTWQNVNLVDKVLVIGSKDHFTKNRKQRLVPIHPKVEEILIKRLPKIIRREKHYIFCKRNGHPFTKDYFSKRFKKACRAAGVDEGLHFHSIRHGAATTMIMNGAPLPAVQRILGHANIQTTMIYTHPDLDSLRDAVGRL